MNVLILCDLFPPAFGPRMGYLCKYLIRAGIEPTVVTEYIRDDTFAFLKGKTNVVYLPFYKSGDSKDNFWVWLKIFLLDLCFGYKNRCIYREAIRQTCMKRYDLILCSTYRTFPLTAACRLARKTGLPLVVDLRDIIEQFSGNELIAHSLPRLGGLENIVATLFKQLSLKQRNRVLRQAVHITTISPWHANVLRRFNPSVSLIYNGFDPELFYPACTGNKQFYITYTGRLLSAAVRNPQLLFEAIKQLDIQGFICPDNFRVRWFTDESSCRIIRHETAKYGVEVFMDYHPYIPATQVPAVLNESAIVLLLANKSDAKGPKGVMTTKFFEALALQRPILCVQGDEGCLEETIRLTRAGLSAHNVDETRQFIEKYYAQWLDSGQTTIDADCAEIEKFSRKTQAEQFIRIFEQICSVTDG